MARYNYNDTMKQHTPYQCTCSPTGPTNYETPFLGTCSNACVMSNSPCNSSADCGGNSSNTGETNWCQWGVYCAAILACVASVYICQQMCFQEDTDIDTPDGKKPIQDIKVGDTVKSYDTKTKEINESKVVNTFIHKDVSNLLTINGIIKTTTNHPFYTNKDEWIEAIDLKPGDKILHVDGEYHEVKTLEQLNHSTTVYNFEVEGDHTYFAEGYLVHNKPGPNPGPIRGAISGTGSTRAGQRMGGVIKTARRGRRIAKKTSKYSAYNRSRRR